LPLNISHAAPADAVTAATGAAGRTNADAHHAAEESVGWRWLLAVFFVSLAAYVLTTVALLRYIEPPTGDQPHYLLETISLVEDGDLDLKNNYTTDESFGQFSSPGRRRGGFRGIPVSYRLDPDGHIVVRATEAGEVWYPKHNAGLPVLIIPGWLLGKAFEPSLLWLTADGGGGWPGTVLQMNVIGALLAVQIFLLAWDVTRSRGIALAVWAALSFSVPLSLVTLLLFAEIPGALALIYAFRHLMRLTLPRTPWRLMLVAAAIGALPWLNPRFMLLAGCLGLLAMLAFWRQSRAAASANDMGIAAATLSEWRTALLLGGPVALAAVGLVWYQTTYFGSATGIADQYEGFFVPNMDGGRLGADWLGLLFGTLGVLLDRQYGLLIYAPVCALATVGMVALWRRPEQRPVALTLACIAAPYFLLTADFRVWWGGWTPPARYIAVVVPLLAAPLAASLLALRPTRWYRLAFGLIAALGILITVAFVAQVGTPDIPQAVFTNPTRTPPFWKWVDMTTGVDLTRYLPALAPWFGNRRLAIPWLEIGFVSTAFMLIVGLAIQALGRSSTGRHATAKHPTHNLTVSDRA